MRLFAISLAVIVLVAQAAQAGHLGLDGWGGPGLGGHHGRFDHGDGFGFRGIGGLNTDRLQTRFETKFTNLQSAYDTGLSDVEDFYNSDEYTNVVDGVTNLVDRYDMFLSSIDRTISHLGDYINTANDDLTYYQDLLTENQARTDLSEERLARIESWLTNVEDRLTNKIDLLTGKQTTLSDNLGTYQTFSGDLSSYLDEITAAGGGTTSTDTTASAALAATTLSAVALQAVAEVAAMDEPVSYCDPPEMALAATAVPEPGAQWLGVVALGLLAAWHPTRRRPRE
jgi:hypothetical protein